MRKALILLFCISLLGYTNLWAQDEELEAEADTTQIKKPYGLRVGADIGKLARTAISADYRGFSLLGDIRISNRFYVAAELGHEKKEWDKDFLRADIDGSYLKVGLDYNAYNNWLDMNNAIYVGFRYGYSSFKETLLSYRVYTTNKELPTEIRDVNMVYDNLNLHWVEFQFGIKTELFKNLFLGLHLEVKASISETPPDNFGILYAPGFNRTYDNSSFGVGYGYSLTYLIPILKK
mgnify:CR=1 FL=1